MKKKKGKSGTKRIVPQKEVIGIDVASKTNSVRIGFKLPEDEKMYIGEEKTFTNDDDGHKALCAHVAKFTHPDCVNRSYVMEATGIYHEDLAYHLHRSGFQVNILLPNRVKAYKQSENELSKTDSIDARLLVKMGLEKTLTNWVPPAAEVYVLKQLSRERYRLLADRTAQKNQIHAIQRSANPSKTTLKRQEAIVKLLEKQIVEVEQEIKLLVKKHSYITEAVNRACTIPGIGLISAVTVLAETNFFLDFNNAKQVTKYAGLDIILKESGTFKGKRRISKRGNSYLRAALYMPSLSAVRYNEPIKGLYERISDKCGVKKKGLIAGCRKLLCLMCSMEKNKKDFDNNYHQKRVEETGPKLNKLAQASL